MAESEFKTGDRVVAKLGRSRIEGRVTQTARGLSGMILYIEVVPGVTQALSTAGWTVTAPPVRVKDLPVGTVFKTGYGPRVRVKGGYVDMSSPTLLQPYKSAMPPISVITPVVDGY